MTGPESTTHADRSPAIPSIADLAARHLPDMRELTAADLPHPLSAVGAPPDWRRAQVSGDPAAPARMLVYGPRPDGSWQACDTLRAFTFHDTLPAGVLHANADCTLQSLGAEHINAGSLAAPPHATAVRSTGHFTAGRHLWAQFSTYLANPTPTTRGLLIEHNVLADADSLDARRADITALCDSVHHAFLTIAAYLVPGLHHVRYDATGLRGMRMRITDDLPTSDAVHIQDALLGVTDVICLDDTPSVMHDLRVHPVGRPDTVALVECSQLALYDAPRPA